MSPVGYIYIIPCGSLCYILLQIFCICLAPEFVCLARHPHVCRGLFWALSRAPSRGLGACAPGARGPMPTGPSRARGWALVKIYYASTFSSTYLNIRSPSSNPIHRAEFCTPRSGHTGFSHKNFSGKFGLLLIVIYIITRRQYENHST